MITGRDQALSGVLIEFAHTLGTDFSVQRILDRLVHRILDVVPVTGAGVMLMGPAEELHFVAASNEVVQHIEGLQNELREGPCLEAYRSGQPVQVDDLRTDSAFPAFSPRALEHGMAAVFTFPLRLDDQRLGALDLYRDAPGPLAESDLQAAQVLADVASAYLFNAQARVDASATVARLNHRSLHDPLTGLPNRLLLEELLEQAVARSRRSHLVTGVLFIDLDGFKAVNDRYGHHVGDRLLVLVAERLSCELRSGDTLARLGGDEFVVLCEDLEDSTQASTLAERITVVLADPFDLGDLELSLSASTGVAFSGPGEELPAAMLRDADFAMYLAKRGGGNGHQVMDPAARLAADRRHDLERDLAKAESAGQLELRYQPILQAATGELSEVEALLRWNHPERGEIMPSTIVPSAERTGLIRSIGEWVLRQACEDLLFWRGRGRELPRLSVNVSAHQLMGPAFAAAVRRVLEDTGVDPAALRLEVTESVFLADAPRSMLVLQELRDLGVGLSLDDFGTGYSSLSYLRQFPFDAVKIDRQFVADLYEDELNRAVVSAMIDLSHVLGLVVTVEGVETAEQLAEVIALGADHVQGFHLAPPLRIDEVTDRLRRSS